MSKWQSGDSWLHYDYREDVSYVYINVPKNASSWMKENFGGYLYNWRRNQFRAAVDSAITLRRGLLAMKHYVVILRDPIDRWLTGFAQALWGWEARLIDQCLAQAPDHWFTYIAGDDHMRPQTEFLVGLDRSSVTWFDCDAMLTHHVREWIAGRFDQPIKGLEEDVNNGYNVSARGRPSTNSGMTQQQLIDRISGTIQSHYLDRLHAIYRDDFDLRRSVEFYGSR